MLHFIMNILTLVVIVKGLRWLLSIIKGRHEGGSYHDYNRREYYSYREEPRTFIGSGSSEKTNENKWDNLFKG